jgi:hypothetical protein
MFHLFSFDDPFTKNLLNELISLNYDYELLCIARFENAKGILCTINYPSSMNPQSDMLAAAKIPTILNSGRLEKISQREIRLSTEI